MGIYGPWLPYVKEPEGHASFIIRSSPGDAVSLPAYAVVNVAGREEENRGLAKTSLLRMR